MKRILVLALLLALPAHAFADTESDAKAVLDTWLRTQNERDFPAYTALYGKSFIGIRRTSEGSEKKMKLKAWKADRKKMFKLKKVEVVADHPVVKAKDKGATITFLQRWRGGGYADHGTKVLGLAYGKSGALEIVKEELLSSTPGWEDDPSAVLDATAMTPPFTVRLKEEGIDPDETGGCTSVTYVLYLKDKKGKTVQRELGGGFVNVEEGATTVAIEPGDDPLYDTGEWCAGGADYYKVKHTGDALIVLYKPEDEGTEDEPPPESKFSTILTVQLPHGAKVVAK